MAWLEAYPQWDKLRLWRDIERAPAIAIEAMTVIEMEFAALAQEPGGAEPPAAVDSYAALGIPRPS